MARRLREFRIKDGSGPVVKAGTKMEAVEIYYALGYHLTCSSIRSLRKEERPKGLTGKKIKK